MDGIANHFPAKNEPDCRILPIQFQNFLCGYTHVRTQREGMTKGYAGAWTKQQFPLGSPAFPLFPFNETAIAVYKRMYVYASKCVYLMFAFFAAARPK